MAKDPPSASRQTPVTAFTDRRQKLQDTAGLGAAGRCRDPAGIGQPEFTSVTASLD